MTKTIKTAILGASGYTGADAMRLALRHPNIEIVALTANTHAGKPVGDVFEHLRGVDLPDLVTLDDVDWKGVDLVICALPHGTTQATTKTIRATNPDCVVVDMSADFRLRDTDTYAQWYGIPHGAPELQGEAAYGLSEHNRDAIAGAKIVACPGCFPTAALTALIPPLADGHIQADDIVIDAKTGISGAGRGLKQGMLFAEAGEGTSPYGIGHHRHMPEIEQELSKASSQAITIGFTPHLVPMSRGELLTCHVRSRTMFRLMMYGPGSQRAMPMNRSCWCSMKGRFQKHRTCVAPTWSISASSRTGYRAGRSSLRRSTIW